jgi:hypothetical protein
MSHRGYDTRTGPDRSGMTLVELTVAVSVMSLVVVVLAGIMTAVDTARRHVEGLHEATALGRFAIGRVHDAVNRTGTYRIGTGATVPGIKVVWTDGRPETLVLWTGGRETSLAEQSPLSRRPRANELVIVTPDPAEPTRLVEIVVPSAADEVDFTASSFATRVRQLISSANAEKVTLCNRLRVVRSPEDAEARLAAVRFEQEATPADEQLAATASGGTAWRALPWAGGISTSTSGLRQVALRVEIQVVSFGSAHVSAEAPALPVFGSAVRRYLYRRG